MNPFEVEGPYSYLVHLLGWSLPVVFFQLVGLALAYRGRFPAVLRATLPPAAAVTAWLVVADHLAIRAGVWRFGEEHLTGLKLGAVPVEEVLFFLITNCLVALGLALFSHRFLRRRAAP